MPTENNLSFLLKHCRNVLDLVRRSGSTVLSNTGTLSTFRFVVILRDQRDKFGSELGLIGPMGCGRVEDGSALPDVDVVVNHVRWAADASRTSFGGKI